MCHGEESLYVSRGTDAIDVYLSKTTKMKLEDGTFFRHPKKEGINPTAKIPNGVK